MNRMHHEVRWPTIRNGRRGVAMLLVLIGLGAATILTFAYLSSRDNSAEIGENVARSANARWAAMSGIDLAVSVLETHTEWRTEHSNGVLFEKYPLSGARVTVELTDLETNSPPHEESTYLRIDSSATANGVTQRASATARIVPLENVNTVSVDLAEFSVFATEQLDMENHALITRWQSAPLSALRQPLYVGTHAIDASSINILNHAAVIDGTLYHLSAASGSLSNSDALRKYDMEDAIPVPDPPMPGVDPPDEIEHGVLNQTSSVNLAGLNRYQSVEMKTLNGIIYLHDAVMVVDGELMLDQYSGMSVDGDADVIVFGDLNMNRDSYIEITPGSTLRLFVKGDIALNDAFIGEQRDDKTLRDNSGEAEWIDPDRVRIFSIVDEDNMAPDWRFLSNSVVKGHVYAPNARLRIRDNSALYGRAAVERMSMANQGAIFHDPSLNNGIGYTNPKSALYDNSGRIRSDYQALARLSQSALQNLSDLLDVNVVGGGLISHDDDDLLSLLGLDFDVRATDPTPRIVRVDINYESFGDDVRRWETRHRNLVAAEGTQ